MTPEYQINKGSKHQNRLCGFCKGRMTPGKRFVLDPEFNDDGGLPMIFHPQCRPAWVKRGRKPLK